MRTFGALTAAAFGLFIHSAAHAADLTVPVVPDAPPPNWTGFYVGGHAGVGWGERDWDGTFLDFPIDDEQFEYYLSGPLLGGQVGFNWQWDQMVLGVEADASWTRMRDSASESFILTTTEATTEVAWLATVRGRLGFDMNGVLLYGTGGIAFAEVDDVDVTRYGNISGTVLGSDSGSARHTGWTAGAGIETMLTDRLSAKFEYLYARFDRRDFNYDLSVLDGDDNDKWEARG